MNFRLMMILIFLNFYVLQELHHVLGLKFQRQELSQTEGQGLGIYYQCQRQKLQLMVKAKDFCAVLKNTSKTRPKPRTNIPEVVTCRKITHFM